MTIFMVMMVAVGIWIKNKISCKVIRNNAVSCAGNAAKQLNPGLCKSVLRTGTNTAAENDIYTVLNKKAHQCTMALPIGRNDLAGRKLTVFDVINLELCGVAKVLVYLTVFIRNCDLHTKNSSLCTRFSFPILTDCGEIGKDTRAFCAFWSGKHSRYVKMISETAAKCIIIEPEKRVQV